MQRSTFETQVTKLRGLGSLLKGDRIVAHNLIAGAGTIIAGLLGVAFQSLFSHRLQPAEYGGVFVVVSLITLVGLPASAFALVMARQTSRDRASGHEGASASLLRNGNRALIFAGLGLAIVSTIVADHQGFVRVKDNEPRGSRFVIELPVKGQVEQIVLH